jgi:hypothetical protein
MRANKEDFEIQITSNDVPKDLEEFGLASISIFKGNIALRFADGAYGGHNPIISKFNIESLADSSNILEKKLINAGFEVKSAQKLIALIVGRVLDKRQQAKSSFYSSATIFEGMEYNDNREKDKTEFIYRYSKLDNKRKKKILHEAVILTSNNSNDTNDQSTVTQPAFLYYDKEQDKIKPIACIAESNRILMPAEEEDYQYIPYTYDMDIDEANLIKDQIKNENATIESFYKQALELVSLFTVQDKAKQVIIAANELGSYFQDKFPTCHYLAITGKPGSGKTSIGHTFGAIGYRPIYQVDPSAPNILRTLGKIEAGQCTLIIDEADKLAMSGELMTTIKTGYEKKGKTPKINQYTNKPEYFHSFCFKLISAERIPKEWKTDGVLDRTLHWISQPGISQYDIKEVLNDESRNAQQQVIFDRIIAFRKKMMIYRLVHFSEPIANIDVGVAMRDKELVKPLLILFYNSNCNNCINDTLKEILESLQSFLDAKNNVKRNSIDEVLFGVVVNLLPESNDYTLPSGLIWKTLIETLEGKGSYNPAIDSKQKSQYEFADYGLLYKATVMKNIVTMFGAESAHRKTGNVIVFSKEKVENLVKMRNERRIKVSEVDSLLTTNRGEGSEGSQSGEGSVEDRHHPHDSTTGECSEGSEGSIGGPPTFIEVYHGLEDNRIEVFPSISSQIRYSYPKDGSNINTQCAIIVGYKTGGASIMPSLPSLPSPTDNTSYPNHIHSSNLEQPEKIKFTPDYEANESVFWRIFKELANEHNGFVSYNLLQGGLISTGKLDAGGSVLMIEHMEKTGKIEQTEEYHVYRRRGGNFASPD